MNRITSYKLLFLYGVFGAGLTTVDDLLGYLFRMHSPWKDVVGFLFDLLFLGISIAFLYILMKRIFASEERVRQSEKLNLAGQLAAGIAHEVRNPLTSLNGFLELLPKAPLHKQLEYTAIMKSELGRIENIVNEMLILAKPHAANYVMKDLLQVLDEVIALMTPQALMKNVTMIKSCDVGSIRMQCEDGQMKQVFINIIKNAIDAMPGGGILEITVAAKEEQLVVCFKDSGHGIAKQDLVKLGEPFYTTKSTGTGLGLLICKRILHDHRGIIEFHSELGQGTSVEIMLPLSAAAVSTG